MQAEVANRGLDIEVEARPMNEAHDHLDECDMLLLGPQIGYTKGDLRRRPPVVFRSRTSTGRLRPHERCGIIDHCVSVMG